MYRSEMTRTKKLSTEGLRSKRRSGKKKKIYHDLSCLREFFTRSDFWLSRIFCSSFSIMKKFSCSLSRLSCSGPTIENVHFFSLLIVGAAYQITGFKPLTPLLSFLDPLCRSWVSIRDQNEPHAWGGANGWRWISLWLWPATAVNGSVVSWNAMSVYS